MKLLTVPFLIGVLVIATFSQNAALKGTVYDRQGAVIPRTKVILKGKSGKKFESLTDSKGEYELQIPTDRYRIEFRAGGFETYILKVFQINPVEKGPAFIDKFMKLDVSLVVGKANQ